MTQDDSTPQAAADREVPAGSGVSVRPLAMLGVFVWDLLVVVSFVAFGRDTHNESLDLSRSFQTALPFLLALAAAWLPARVRARPSTLASGLAVGVVTAALGLILRGTVFNEGLSGAFPIIASVYLIGLMVLGRTLWARLHPA